VTTTAATRTSAASQAAATTAVVRRGARVRPRTVGVYVLLTLASIIVAFPLLLALSYSFMSEGEIASYPPRLLPSTLQLDNYQRVLSNVPLARYLLNSFLASSLVVIGQLITASLAAFAFSFLVFPGRGWLFGLFLATMMIPWEATIIPNYMTIRSLGWLDTYQGLSVPFMAQAFGTFLLRQSFLQLPRDLFDAAVVDGAGKLRFLWAIVLPLSRPALATLAVYAFLWTWNLYFWPLLITNDPLMRTTQVGIGQLRFEETLRWGYVMAGVTMIVLPTLLLLVLGQRHLVRGLTAGAVKG
jgi:sn-glycerol 3-phosphate transport system permease protein